MNKLLSAVAKAGTAALVGYEVGQSMNEHQIIKIESETPQMQATVIGKHNEVDLQIIVYTIVFLILVLIILTWSKIFFGKKITPARLATV